MPDNFAIRVSGLGKEYTLGGAERVDESFREMLLGSLTAPFRRLKKLSGESVESERFWALKGVNFEIKPGEVVGIIGRNGAGKSTLLKILSRITDPTEGKIEIKGRISSLLEVGTGFHPELTGRENIFLNGAILGMSRREIKQKFDEIVAFAEVDKFLDTPVKRYSSGMYVRLAFAVAAHLEPEILVVDEVLAVGDAAFQKKCLGKMSDVAKEGRTVLFVSHNMGAVEKLCHRVLLLQKGSIFMDGLAHSVIPHYMGGNTPEVLVFINDDDLNYPHIKHIEVVQPRSEACGFKIDKPIELIIKLNTYGVSDLEVGLRVNNMQGVCIHHSSSAFGTVKANDKKLIRRCTIPAYGLNSGKYSVDISLGKRNYQLFEKKENILRFDVFFSGILSDKTSADQWHGACGPGFLQWQ